MVGTCELSSAPQGPNSRFILTHLDLNVPSTVTGAVSRIQNEHLVDHIDIVIANAGICYHWGPVLNMEDSDMMAHFDVNTLGPLRLFRSIAPLLKASKQPKFVYLSSELARIAKLNHSSSLTTA